MFLKPIPTNHSKVSRWFPQRSQFIKPFSSLSAFEELKGKAKRDEITLVAYHKC
jgi:hypothetical protein